MPIEAANFVQGLVPDNPPGTDFVQEGDNHLRLIKQVLQNTFPNANRAVYDQKAQTVAVNTSLTSAMNKQVVEVNASSADRTITLPAGMNAASDGWSVIIMKIDASANTVFVAPASGSIMGQQSIALHGQFEFAEFIWTGGAWRATQRVFKQWIDTKTISATTTFSVSDYGRLFLVNAAADLTMNLPTVVNFDGAIIGFKHTGTNGKRVTLNPSGSQEIDGAANYSFTNKGDCVWLVSTGTGWETYSFKVGRGFSPNQINNWTATQIFVGASLVLAEQTLTINANNNVAWNHDLGNHAKILVDEDCTFLKPTNMRVGQSGFLRITVSGNRDIDFANTFFFLQGDPPALDAGTVTILEYFVSAADNIYIWPVSGAATGYVDYDKGQLNNGTSYTQAHGLGQLPSAVQGYMKCVNANAGYAVGDYVLLPSSPVGDNDRGSTISFNTAQAFIQTGNGGQAIYPQNSGNAFIVTESDWHLIIRVYA